MGSKNIPAAKRERRRTKRRRAENQGKAVTTPPLESNALATVYNLKTDHAAPQAAEQGRQHRMIRLDDVALSQEQAAKRIFKNLRALGVAIESEEKFLSGIKTIKGHGGVIIGIFDDEHKKEKDIDIFDILQGTIKTGEVPDLDRILWHKRDPFGSVSASTNAKLPPTVVSSGPHTSEPLHAPGLVTNDVVSECLSDILYYRVSTAESSAYLDGFRPCFRNFRSYLSSCIITLDAWINREAYFALMSPSTKLSTKDQKTLSRVTVPLDVKLQNWMGIIHGRSVDVQSQSWQAYSAIKQQRNKLLHLNEPAFAFSVEHAAAALNLCRMGVGLLLVELYNIATRTPLPSVYRVAFAPPARFTHRP